MALYTPPGVFFKDSTSANYSSTNVWPSSVGIFGRAVTSLQFSEEVEIPADIEEDLEADPEIIGRPVPSDPLQYANPSNIVVSNASGVLELNEDYVLITTESDGNDYISIERIEESTNISDTGDTVRVTYDYTPLQYSETLRFSDSIDIRAFYGEPFDDEGNVQSELSLAAEFALKNGAPSVICVAVSEDTESSYISALKKLEKAKDVAVITSASGDQDLFSEISSSVSALSKSGYERRAILGVDGTSNALNEGSLSQIASNIGNKRVAFVAPSVVKYKVGDNLVKIGGQYLAAAIAGIAVGMPIQEPLTRKRISGFPDFEDSFTTAEKNSMSANGVMVVEQTIQGILRIRHGVTTDTSSKNASEWSITGATDYVIAGLRDILETSTFIGSPITGETVPSLTGMVDSFLISCTYNEIIRDYDDLTVIQRVTEPDIIDIRFSIGYLFPLNRIMVTLSSSSMTGDSTVSLGG